MHFRKVKPAKFSVQHDHLQIIGLEKNLGFCGKIFRFLDYSF